MSRRAKIVCTIGPATATPERIQALVEAGMDVARLNFSHGTHVDHKGTYGMVREASDRTGRAVGILADLQGPKIRLGRFEGGRADWPAGREVVITNDPVPLGTAERVGTTYPRLAAEVGIGESMLVDDGKLSLKIIDVVGNDVRCFVVEGGEVSDHKGLSLPNSALSTQSLSDKDAADLRFALGLSVDFVALSFVRDPADVEPVRAIMAEMGVEVPVIAKLEKPQAVGRLREIVRAFDALMVARGDLGVELPLEQVPMVQKRAIQIARENAKPVIVATQMLESMITASRPTRAEASDVANAVLDGADALMLSGETSVGRHPVLAVATMARIIDSVESDSTAVPSLLAAPRTTGGVLTRAAKDVGELTGAKALAAFTQSGDTVRRLARLHTPLHLLAFTPEPRVRSQLALTWGVETFLVPSVRHTDEMVRELDKALMDSGRLTRGDLVVIVAGTPPNVPGTTNLIRLHRVGEEH